MLCVSPPAARAQSEDQIKAAFLFNFARYVEWPASRFDGPQDVIRLCLVGDAPFAEVVSQTVSGKRVEDRRVEVEILGDLREVTRCHLLYLGGGFATNVAEVVSRLGDSSVFTVADRAGFAAEGGVANFIRSDNKIRFEINPNAARRSGLKISSRLLRLAKLVDSQRVE